MAGWESDDDDVFVVPETVSPSPKKYLRRLKKGASRKSEADQACSSKQVEHKPEILEKANSCISSDDLQSADLAEKFPLETEFDDAGQMFVKKTDQDDEIGSELEEKADDSSLGEEDEAENNCGDDDSQDEVDEEDEEANGGDEDSQDEVDEDDEEAVLNLLGRERNVLEQSASQRPLDVPTIAEFPSANDIERTGKGTKRKGRMDELEEIHAQSQRLLREATRVSFKPQQPVRKSLSSVLDKIRTRKLQLAQGLEKKPLSFPLPRTEEGAVDVMLDDDLAMEFDKGDNGSTLPGDERLLAGAERNYQDESNQKVQKTVLEEIQDNATIDNHVPSPPESHIDQRTSDNACNALFKGGDAFRAPMEDTQDLFSNSQLSHEEDDDANLATALEEEEVLGSVSQVNLHLDTETQDDIEHWPNECSNKENLDPPLSGRIELARLATAPGVKALIDDEAEDEDEALIGLADEEDPDEGEDLKDLVTCNSNEKAGDVHKRAELHRKWLEQQDSAMTDEILLRLKTGWLPGENRKRGLDFLDEDDDIFPKLGSIGFKQVDETQLEPGIHKLSEFPEDISQNAEASKEEDCEEETKIDKTFTAMDDLHESSDDDEAEQKLLRQRLLEESEEQEEITLPADDETSREIFALINKVNIATHKKNKLGSSETRSLGGTSSINSSSNSKSSFLRRTASSSLQPVPRQNSTGSGTRSFIFGRDDSNSNSGLGLSNGETLMEEMKENVEPPQGSKRDYSDTRVRGAKTGRSNQKSSNLPTSGPSLFDILKRQATDLDQALQNKKPDAMSKSVVPIFTAFKPNRSYKNPRGA